jgi:hypothetical protein
VPPSPLGHTWSHGFVLHGCYFVRWRKAWSHGFYLLVNLCPSIYLCPSIT